METVIIYATKYGCTEKYAKSLSEQIKGKVELLNIKNNKEIDLTKYEKIIIGGSIYMGRIQKEVKELCVKNIDELKDKKLGFFICCMQKEEIAVKQLNESFPEELLINAIDKKIFTGELKISKMGFFDRLITKMVAKSDNDDFPKVDKDKDVSFINEEKVSVFAKAMNNA